MGFWGCKQATNDPMLLSRRRRRRRTGANLVRVLGTGPDVNTKVEHWCCVSRYVCEQPVLHLRPELRACPTLPTSLTKKKSNLMSQTSANQTSSNRPAASPPRSTSPSPRHRKVSTSQTKILRTDLGTQDQAKTRRLCSTARLVCAAGRPRDWRGELGGQMLESILGVGWIGQPTVERLRSSGSCA